MARSNTAALVVGSGLALGVAIDLLTFLVARYGPSGASASAAWSFRGNGALIVPFGLGPIVLAAGWTAVVLHGRAGVAWLRWSLIVAAIGLVLLAGSVLATIFGNLAATSWLTPLILVLPLVAPVGLVLFYRRPQPNATRHALAQAAFTISGLAGFVVAQTFVPPGS